MDRNEVSPRSLVYSASQQSLSETSTYLRWWLLSKKRHRKGLSRCSGRAGWEGQKEAREGSPGELESGRSIDSPFFLFRDAFKERKMASKSFKSEGEPLRRVRRAGQGNEKRRRRGEIEGEGEGRGRERKQARAKDFEVVGRGKQR